MIFLGLVFGFNMRIWSRLVDMRGLRNRGYGCCCCFVFVVWGGCRLCEFMARLVFGWSKQVVGEMGKLFMEKRERKRRREKEWVDWIERDG